MRQGGMQYWAGLGRDTGMELLLGPKNPSKSVLEGVLCSVKRRWGGRGQYPGCLWVWRLNSPEAIPSPTDQHGLIRIDAGGLSCLRTLTGGGKQTPSSRQGRHYTA